MEIGTIPSPHTGMVLNKPKVLASKGAFLEEVSTKPYHEKWDYFFKRERILWHRIKRRQEERAMLLFQWRGLKGILVDKARKICRIQTKEDPRGQYWMWPSSPSCPSAPIHAGWLMIPKCASTSRSLAPFVPGSDSPWAGCTSSPDLCSVTCLSGAEPYLLKFYLFFMLRISPFGFSALWAYLTVHPPTLASSIALHMVIHTCMYIHSICIPTCICACTHIRYEVYIKGAWEILHDDSFYLII